jgi:hypothetical protein
MGRKVKNYDDSISIGVQKQMKTDFIIAALQAGYKNGGDCLRDHMEKVIRKSKATA